MKINRITWLILGIGVLAVAGAGLYPIYQDQLEEQDKLNQSISAAQAALPGLLSETGALEEQLAQLEDELAQAEVRLSQAEAGFPESVQSIFYGDLLFSLAESLDLKVISFTATEPAKTEDENISYEVTYFVVAIRGEVANVLQYITRIEVDDEFRTASIETVGTTIPLPLTEQEKEAIRVSLTQEILEELADEELTEEERAKLLEQLAEKLAEAEAEIEELEMPSATINLRILSYEG